MRAGTPAEPAYPPNPSAEWSGAALTPTLGLTSLSRTLANTDLWLEAVANPSHPLSTMYYSFDGGSTRSPATPDPGSPMASFGGVGIPDWLITDHHGEGLAPPIGASTLSIYVTSESGTQCDDACSTAGSIVPSIGPRLPSPSDGPRSLAP